MAAAEAANCVQLTALPRSNQLGLAALGALDVVEAGTGVFSVL